MAPSAFLHGMSPASYRSTAATPPQPENQTRFMQFLQSARNVPPFRQSISQNPLPVLDPKRQYPMPNLAQAARISGRGTTAGVNAVIYIPNLKMPPTIKEQEDVAGIQGTLLFEIASAGKHQKGYPVTVCGAQYFGLQNRKMQKTLAEALQIVKVLGFSMSQANPGPTSFRNMMIDRPMPHTATHAVATGGGMAFVNCPISGPEVHEGQRVGLICKRYTVHPSTRFQVPGKAKDRQECRDAKTGETAFGFFPYVMPVNPASPDFLDSYYIEVTKDGKEIYRRGQGAYCMLGTIIQVHGQRPEKSTGPQTHYSQRLENHFHESKAFLQKLENDIQRYQNGLVAERNPDNPYYPGAPKNAHAWVNAYVALNDMPSRHLGVVAFLDALFRDWDWKKKFEDDANFRYFQECLTEWDALSEAQKHEGMYYNPFYRATKKLTYGDEWANQGGYDQSTKVDLLLELPIWRGNAVFVQYHGQKEHKTIHEVLLKLKKRPSEEEILHSGSSSLIGDSESMDGSEPGSSRRPSAGFAARAPSRTHFTLGGMQRTDRTFSATEGSSSHSPLSAMPEEGKEGGVGNAASSGESPVRTMLLDGGRRSSEGEINFRLDEELLQEAQQNPSFQFAFAAARSDIPEKLREEEEEELDLY